MTEFTGTALSVLVAIAAFLVCVVTALVGILTLLAAIFGIYIGLKDWKISKEYKEAKDTISQLQEKFDSITQILSQFGITSIYLSHALQFSQLIKTEKSSIDTLPSIRDMLSKVLLTLQPLKGQKLRYGQKECITFRKEAQNIKLNLASVQYPGYVQDLIKKCDEIIEIIDGLSFD